MKNTNPPDTTPFNSTVRALGRPPALVATTMAVGSGSSPCSFAAKASASQAANSAYGSAGASASRSR